MTARELAPRCGHPTQSGRPCGRPASHPGRHVPQTLNHDLNGYKRGCRCETCRAAKGAEQRAERAAAAAIARPGVAVAGVKHGTRRAYRERGCRCEDCTKAMRAVWVRWEANREAAHGRRIR